ncbi:chemotaxis protein CheV [Exilibacterium tricleocarpae]|uniref:Chemotaxis protein CheV n=1 Tax=Exilibacterium tricleocarpae TaxID=2591008 RepID=A0A545U3S3_9GAMM|nr:chemotaxis protein CheV [Exilibacterium tricleocarpae]TQV84128.1 chemotaxis protein CheV [Exilibacterium tricleocarpae]
MAGLMDSVNQRTQLVGQNRLELLLFRLGSKQLYGINVFKVKEVLQCPVLNELPKCNPVVRGVAHIRGGTISVMDMSQATGNAPLDALESCFIIITEYNRSTQGFLVSTVERIVNMNWEDIHPPPRGAGKENYLTAVTEVEGNLVEIIDVEKILAEVSPPDHVVSDGVIDEEVTAQAQKRNVLIVDDSAIARKQIKRVIESMGLQTILKCDGRQALDYLHEMIEEGKEPCQELALVISDIEMPEMDGYTFTAEVRTHPQLKDLHIVLHTSLSGVFNEAMVKKVGADDFVAKFHPDDLAKRINDRLKTVNEGSLSESE